MLCELTELEDAERESSLGEEGPKFSVWCAKFQMPKRSISSRWLDTYIVNLRITGLEYSKPMVY